MISIDCKPLIILNSVSIILNSKNLPKDYQDTINNLDSRRLSWYWGVIGDHGLNWSFSCRIYFKKIIFRLGIQLIRLIYDDFKESSIHLIHPFWTTLPSREILVQRYDNLASEICSFTLNSPRVPNISLLFLVFEHYRFS